MASGACHAHPPVVSLIVRIVKRDDGEPDEGASDKVQGAYGRWPVVKADTSCCSLHQSFESYRVSFSAGRLRPVVPDDDDPFNP